MIRFNMVLAASLAAFITVATAHGQCEPEWLPGSGIPGVNGNVNAATVWDADGAGPAPSFVVAAGAFTFAGTASALNVAAWNPASGQWVALGGGVSSEIRDVAVIPNGSGGHDLLVATAFGVERWNGNAWSLVGGGLNVHAMVTLPSGEIVVGGGAGVLRLSGNSWVSLPGWPGYSVISLAALPDGRIVAGGTSGPGGVPGGIVAVWDGAWTVLDPGLTNSAGRIEALLAHSSGDIYAAGSFFSVPGYIARWDGGAWSPVGSGLTGLVYTLAEDLNGDIVAGGNGLLPATPSGSHTVARWNGSTWSGLGRLNNSVRALAVAPPLPGLPGGGIVAGGHFTMANNTHGTQHIALWDGGTWSSLGTGLTPSVAAMAVHDGELVIGGGFVTSSGTQRLAKRQGTEWVPFPPGATHPADAPNQPLVALHAHSDGSLYVGGSFSSIGGVSASRIARWSGNAWTAPGGGALGEFVWTMAESASGDLIAGGWLSSIGSAAGPVARWDGAAWHPYEPIMSDPHAMVLAVAPLQSGRLIAGGDFLTVGPAPGMFTRLALWDGAWQNMGPVNSLIHAIAVMPNHDVVVGGSFSTIGGVSASGIARWDGAAWHPLGSGINAGVQSLLLLPGGELLVGGSFTSAGGTPAANIARWDGVWSPLGAGVNGPVWAMTMLPDGTVAIGGEFTTAGGQPSAGVAYLRCPAPAPCYPNCDGSTVEPVLNVDDFTCFINEFAAAQILPHAQQVEHYANCDGSTVAPVLNVDDFTCFINEYAQGCP